MLLYFHAFYRSIKCDSLTLMAISGIVLLVGLTIALIISIILSSKVLKLFVDFFLHSFSDFR